MNKYILFTLGLLLLSCKQIPKFEYPKIAKETVIDEYHGQKIEDPYRNLENIKDSTVINWFKKQSLYARSILDTIPERERLFKKQSELDHRKKWSISKTAFQNDDSCFYLKRKKGDDDPAKLYYRKSLDAKEKLVYNPINYKPNHRITYFKPNWNQTKVAIALTERGKNISEIIVYDLTNNTVSPHVIKNAAPNKAGKVQWLPNHSGFIYQHFPNIDHSSKAYLTDTRAVLYTLNTDPTKIKDVFSAKNNPTIPIKKADFPVVKIKRQDSKYIFAIIGSVAKYKDHYYADLKKEMDYTKINWKPLFKKEEKIRSFEISNDDIIYRTSKNASNFKICKTSITNPNFNAPTVLVEEKQDRVITDFEFVDNVLYYTTLKNGVESKFFSLKSGTETEIELPIASGDSYIKYRGSSFIVSAYGWTNPYKVYKFDIKTEQFTTINLSSNIEYPEFSDFVVEEIEIPSHDGVLVPLSIIYKKGLKKDGKNKLISLSYGSYGLSFSPYFSIPFLTWVLEGGVWAIPHVRGGGEKGDHWYRSGYKTTKPNSWKDLIACTEYLIDKGYTSSNQNIAYGASAAGITIGRAITERPDLFAAVIMNAPATNMLRCEIQPNGPNSIKEFGTVKDSIEFKALLEMDAYHHIKKNTSYPSIMVSSGMNDGAVVPWDPAKFVARMQNSSSSEKPVIFSVDFNANHHGNGTSSKFLKEMSDSFAFAFWQTGHPDYQPKK